MRAGRVMTWQEALGLGKLSKGETAFVEAARNHDLRSGLGFPLWGAHGQDAYVAIGFPNDVSDRNPADLREEHMILIAGHIRIIELLPVEPMPVALSERERDVLTWVAKGKSNTDIATIIDIAPETVATYMRRIYRKLGCNDRVGAVLKAARSRLIRV